MGRPKHLLAAGDSTLLEHIGRRLAPMFVEMLLVGRDPERTVGGMRFVADLRPERSPLVGIYSGLCAATAESCFVIGCDMPFAVPDLVRDLLEQPGDRDVVVPVHGGFCEPLFAVYRRSCIPAIAGALDEGMLKTTSFYSEVTVRRVSEDAVRRIDPDLVSFTNLNTPKQLALLAHL